ncbi:hypothetical protein [Nocardia thailandica]
MSTDAIFKDPAFIRAVHRALEDVWDSPSMRATWKQISDVVAANVNGPVIDPALAAHIVRAAAPDLERIRAVFDEVIANRQVDLPSWLPDGFDPFAPLQVNGLPGYLPAARHRILVAAAAAVAYVRALTHHRHRRADEPPGHTLTARAHITRGPNTRSTNLAPSFV